MEIYEYKPSENNDDKEGIIIFLFLSGIILGLILLLPNLAT
jgi:hypothetical protein